MKIAILLLEILRMSTIIDIFILKLLREFAWKNREIAFRCFSAFISIIKDLPKKILLESKSAYQKPFVY